MRELQPLPLGVSDFHKLRGSGKIYVDKTELIYQLVATYEKLFLARPRRFGKSLLVSTFESLFKYGLKDFKGLAIEKLWKEEKTYNVVRLDFSGIKNFDSVEDFKTKLTSLLAASFMPFGFVYKEGTVVNLMDQISIWFASLASNSLVLLIDEYDAPLTSCLNDSDLFKSVRNELSTFYSKIKSNDSAIRFLFITGITKFNKTSIFSELNTLTDVSLSPRFGSLLGYTHEEVEKYFGDYLEYSAEALDTDKEKLLEGLTTQYDGFCFEETVKKKVFAPWSLLTFFSEPERGLKNYWFGSGGRPSALLQYLKSHALKDPEEYGRLQSIALSTLTDSADINSLSDIGLLTQAGYLTLKKIVGTTAYLGYPNEEVRLSMAHLYTECLLAGRTVEQVGADNIAYRLATENAESALHILNRLFSSIDYQHYPVKDESSVRAFIQVFFSGAGLNPIVEHHNYMGRSDLEVRAGNNYWVFEFKYCRENENPGELLQKAIEQIQTRHYGEQIVSGNLIRVALVFSEKVKQFVKWSLV